MLGICFFFSFWSFDSWMEHGFPVGFKAGFYCRITPLVIISGGERRWNVCEICLQDLIQDH